MFLNIKKKLNENYFVLEILLEWSMFDLDDVEEFGTFDLSGVFVLIKVWILMDEYYILL